MPAARKSIEGTVHFLFEGSCLFHFRIGYCQAASSEQGDARSSVDLIPGNFNISPTILYADLGFQSISLDSFIEGTEKALSLQFVSSHVLEEKPIACSEPAKASTHPE